MNESFFDAGENLTQGETHIDKRNYWVYYYRVYVRKITPKNHGVYDRKSTRKLEPTRDVDAVGNLTKG